MSGLLRRVLHTYDMLGPKGFALQLVSKLSGRRGSADLPAAARRVHPFDAAHSTDTSGCIPGDQLEGDESFHLYCTAYLGISPSTLRAALALMPEPLSTFTFIDLGCGKGRALLVAAEYPFLKVIGVELAPDLCSIAKENTKSMPRISVEQDDAARARYPDGPLLVFLYHPFLAPVLHRVLRNLREQRRNLTHPTYLLYANCRSQKLIGRYRFLKLVWDRVLEFSAEDAAFEGKSEEVERYSLSRVDYAASEMH